MSDWLLLTRAMVRKEMRATFRENHQRIGLLIVGIIIAIVLVSFLRQIRRDAGNVAVSTTQPVALAGAPMTDPQTAVILRASHWIAIGAAVGVAMFVSMSYIIAGVLASFVGEKEGRTLEILLASPLSDRKLFITKCLGTWLPSAGVGYIAAVSFIAVVFIALPRDLIHIDVGLQIRLLLDALVLSIPVMLLPQLWLLGIGVAISARAETMKGAGQILSLAVLVPMFGIFYGVPLLLHALPGLRPPVIALGRRFLTLPFAGQYLIILLILFLPAALCLGVAWKSFRRDRMLT